MNYQTIVKDDLINGTGVRVSLYVSGCSHGCVGCFNESAWDYRSGTVFGSEQIETIRTELSKSYIEGLTLLGGDPLMPKNIDTVLDLCKLMKEEFPDKNIWCWTGYTLEEVKNNHANDILKYIDVLVDGKFVEELKNLKLPFRGSENQRILIKGKDYE
ncbi:Ribonucleotide reductase of class III (anaerobic), activating protein [Yersinia phage fHe-Yen9-04]|uniref:Ribonucleotide reductase of class III (Anaerobic), activating protein n=1 Tax=Yersinia phage fHe-Yen9-04 TaxID=2052742 RepID=A0A2C9CZG1_9CAUD|nr:anaerobic ribonucleotide reductase small subunit [Yersinia phage fHe-Yen9-04]SOK58412.1 Ribonucleotide reductase of class III (anaerobic), activating protein [Yersinia phage fHe-Yen9-04]VUE36181.1 Ribonucleotide reductase of class III (anaerobic), activating protein [Yersinia phage fHe-Yen9-04]